jgi:hypothetical protein
MQYQLKPQYVEAVQFQGVPPDSNGEAQWSERPEWLVDALTSKKDAPRKIFVDQHCNANVQTVVGVLIAEPGDYVVTLPGSLGVQARESFEFQYEAPPAPAVEELTES